MFTWNVLHYWTMVVIEEFVLALIPLVMCSPCAPPDFCFDQRIAPCALFVTWTSCTFALASMFASYVFKRICRKEKFLGFGFRIPYFIKIVEFTSRQLLNYNTLNHDTNLLSHGLTMHMGGSWKNIFSGAKQLTKGYTGNINLSCTFYQNTPSQLIYRSKNKSDISLNDILVFAHYSDQLVRKSNYMHLVYVWVLRTPYL